MTTVTRKALQPHPSVSTNPAAPQTHQSTVKSKGGPKQKSFDVLKAVERYKHGVCYIPDKRSLLAFARHTGPNIVWLNQNQVLLKKLRDPKRTFDDRVDFFKDILKRNEKFILNVLKELSRYKSEAKTLADILEILADRIDKRINKNVDEQKPIIPEIGIIEVYGEEGSFVTKDVKNWEKWIQAPRDDEYYEYFNLIANKNSWSRNKKDYHELIRDFLSGKNIYYYILRQDPIVINAKKFERAMFSLIRNEIEKISKRLAELYAENIEEEIVNEFVAHFFSELTEERARELMKTDEKLKSILLPYFPQLVVKKPLTLDSKVTPKNVLEAIALLQKAPESSPRDILPFALKVADCVTKSKDEKVLALNETVYLELWKLFDKEKLPASKKARLETLRLLSLSRSFVQKSPTKVLELCETIIAQDAPAQEEQARIRKLLSLINSRKSKTMLKTLSDKKKVKVQQQVVGTTKKKDPHQITEGFIQSITKSTTPDEMKTLRTKAFDLCLKYAQSPKKTLLLIDYARLLAASPDPKPLEQIWKQVEKAFDEDLANAIASPKLFSLLSLHPELLDSLNNYFIKKIKQSEHLELEYVSHYFKVITTLKDKSSAANCFENFGKAFIILEEKHLYRIGPCAVDVIGNCISVLEALHLQQHAWALSEVFFILYREFLGDEELLQLTLGQRYCDLIQDLCRRMIKHFTVSADLGEKIACGNSLMRLLRVVGKSKMPQANALTRVAEPLMEICYDQVLTCRDFKSKSVGLMRCFIDAFLDCHIFYTDDSYSLKKIESSFACLIKQGDAKNLEYSSLIKKHAKLSEPKKCFFTALMFVAFLTLNERLDKYELTRYRYFSAQMAKTDAKFFMMALAYVLEPKTEDSKEKTSHLSLMDCGFAVVGERLYCELMKVITPLGVLGTVEEAPYLFSLLVRLNKLYEFFAPPSSVPVLLRKEIHRGLVAQRRYHKIQWRFSISKKAEK